jgi:hypothetical protein
VPADSLDGREILLLFEQLSTTIVAEVRGVRANGKPRLRKFDKDNRQNLHLPQLVLATLRLPEPAREDLTHTVLFPLENKAFVMQSMDFDVVEDDGLRATLAPLRMTILHSDLVINLADREKAVADDLIDVAQSRVTDTDLVAAVSEHQLLISAGVNTSAIRLAADRVIERQSALFGSTNAGSIRALTAIDKLPETEFDADLSGVEGRLLYREHYYRERNRTLVVRAKNYYRSKNSGKLLCDSCGFEPTEKYGEVGSQCIEAHHRTPIAELQPGSVSTVADLAMVCANCHKIIHSVKPCMTIEQLQALLTNVALFEPNVSA